MKQHSRVIILWLLLIVGMILHFNYHIGGLVYGLNVTQKNANGAVPSSVVWIRNIFYHMPMIWIICLLYCTRRWILILFLLISIAYLLSNAVHLAAELTNGQNDLSQVCLLAVVLLVSAILSLEHYRLVKNTKYKVASASL